MTGRPWHVGVAVMSHWRDRPEGGNRFWLIVITWCILNIGRGFARAMMWPTALYFFLRRGPERRASSQWLLSIQAPTRGYLGVLRHIYTFSMTIVDRVLLLSGRDQELDIQVDGVESLHDTLRDGGGRGCILLGSHLGSFEAIRVFNRRAPREFQGLKVVMDRQQSTLITQVMEALSPGIGEAVIDARQPGPQIVLQAADTVANGGMVAMLADRVFHQESVIQVPFLGQPAPFPLAPFAMATALKVPVFMVFGLYEGGRRYRLVFERLQHDDEATGTRTEKRARLGRWVAEYAQRLEHYARRYPYNWFNFYDFWSTARPAAAANSAVERD